MFNWKYYIITRTEYKLYIYFLATYQYKKVYILVIIVRLLYVSMLVSVICFMCSDNIDLSVAKSRPRGNWV